MAPRETWSNAPTASTERMVACGHASVAARSNRLTASVPVRVPSIALSESDQAADPKTLEHSRGEFRTGKPKGGAVQQLGILLVVEENAEMLVGGAGGSSSGAAWGSTQTVKESRQG